MTRPVDRSGLAGKEQPVLAPQGDAPGLPELRHRIEMLRQQACRRAGRTTDSVSNVAISLLVVCSAILVIAVLVAVTWAYELAYLPWQVVLFLLPLAIGGYGLRVLTSVHSMQQVHSAQTLATLRQTSLGIVLVHKEYCDELVRQRARRHTLAPPDRPVQATVEQQLTWCAFHFNSIARCYQRQDLNLSNRYAVERLIQSLAWLYRFDTALYFFGGCAMLILLPFTVPLHLLFCWNGAHQVIAQARLVAICDFLLGEGVDPNDVGWD